MGLEVKKIVPKEEGDKSKRIKQKGQKPPPAGGDSNGTDKVKAAQERAARDKKRKEKEKELKAKGILCFKCGKSHYASNCKASKEEKEKWAKSPAGKKQAADWAASKKNAKATATPGGEDKSPPGGKPKALKKNSNEDGSCEVGADGPATVNGVTGCYTCDGGCDKATIGCVYAESLAASGVEVIEYPKPLNATLANGEVGPLVTHYCVAKVVLSTKAGDVVLPRTHIDVLQGPIKGHLLYIGKAEEKRLKLRSFASQLEDVARKQSKDVGKAYVTAGGEGSKVKVNTRKSESGEATVSFKQEPRFKRRLGVVKERPPTAQPPREIREDGQLFVGGKHWSILQETPYLCEPFAERNYVTTAARDGLEYKLDGQISSKPVKTLDLGESVKDWLRGDQWLCNVTVTLRVLPDGQYDIVNGLTQVREAKCRVVASDKAAVVIGRRTLGELLERKCEDFAAGAEKPIDAEKIQQRLEEMLDAARLAGMSKQGLARARKLIMDTCRDVWRLTLGAKDVADLPAMPIELKDGAPPLPKPYMRRYTPPELEFWDVVIKEMLDAGIIRKSNATEVSPSNLVRKKVDGEWSDSVFRTIIDL